MDTLDYKGLKSETINNNKSFVVHETFDDARKALTSLKTMASKENSWHHDQNLAEIPAVNLAKKLSFSRKSWRDSWQDRAKSLGIFTSWRVSWRH